MNTDDTNWVKQTLQGLYPNLFDDTTNVSKLDTLVPLVDTTYHDAYFNQLGATKYRLAVVYLTASALWWDEQADGQVDDLQADVLRIGLDTSGKDVYYPRFTQLVSTAGGNSDWGIQFL